jgi:formylglycine-generating enzyme required for sulfatase activity
VRKLVFHRQFPMMVRGQPYCAEKRIFCWNYEGGKKTKKVSVIRTALLIGIVAMAILITGCSKNTSTGIDSKRSTDTISVATGIKMVMVSIPAGTFQMGSANLGFTPVHRVTLGAFTMSQTLVTQEQYQAVMDTNPSFFNSGGKWPVDWISWYDAALFCNALSKLTGMDTVYTFTFISGTPGAGCSGLGNLNIDYTRNGYRLPTEAEYEYAERAGTTSDYYWGRNYPPTTTADTLAIDSNAVWSNNSPHSTQPVATKKPNPWGLYDMSGDLWEWCNDFYGSYSDSSQTNPTGGTNPGINVLRGGSWSGFYPASSLCSAYRNSDELDDLVPRDNIYGFRVVCGAR